MKETGCRCHDFALPNSLKNADSLRPARDANKKDKSRNHPANPVGEPDPHLHTLTGAPVQTELKPILGRDAGPFFTFSHFGNGGPAPIRRGMVPGLICHAITIPRFLEIAS